MRPSEWIQTVFPAQLAAAAWLTSFTSGRLPRRRQWFVTALAATAIAVIALAHLTAPFLPTDTAAILSDCLTVALFLVPYWQTGQFFLEPNPKIQQRLLAIDRSLLPSIATKSGTERTSIGLFLEMAYLSCYPLVPLGLLAVYLAGLRNRAQDFWLIVLISTYLCYAITPFVPAYPPRSLMEYPSANPANRANKGRVFNRWILTHGSIHAISFPSAHVASAFAIALFLLRYSWPIGVIFLAIAVAISLGAVIGRYHYALDVILGALTPLIVFVITLKT